MTHGQSMGVQRGTTLAIGRLYCGVNQVFLVIQTDLVCGVELIPGPGPTTSKQRIQSV